MGFGPVISWFYDEPRIKFIAIIISLDLFFGGLTTQHRALLIKNYHFYKNAFIGIIATILSYGIAIFLALQGWGYWAIVSRWVVFGLVEFMGAWAFCKWRPGLPAHNARIIPMVKFGLNMLGNFTVSYFSRNIDKILIGWRYGSLSLGYYDRAYNLFQEPAQRISRPIFNVAVVTLSRLRDNPEKYRRYYLNSISLMAFVGFPISAILTVMSKDIILLLLGPQWKEAAPFLSVFSLSIGIQMIYQTNPWLHISLGRSNKLLRWNILATTFFVISFLVGLKFGPIGVVIGYTASIYILMVPSLWYAGKEINLKVSSIIEVIWKFFLSAIFTGLFYLYVLHSIDYTSRIIVKFNLFTKCLVSTLFCVIAYNIFIVIMFQSTKPIREFISVGLDMLPRGVKK
jgi:PST family polysaccharide transporter